MRTWIELDPIGIQMHFEDDYTETVLNLSYQELKGSNIKKLPELLRKKADEIQTVVDDLSSRFLWMWKEEV